MEWPFWMVRLVERPLSPAWVGHGHGWSRLVILVGVRHVHQSLRWRLEVHRVTGLDVRICAAGEVRDRYDVVLYLLVLAPTLLSADEAGLTGFEEGW